MADEYDFNEYGLDEAETSSEPEEAAASVIDSLIEPVPAASAQVVDYMADVDRRLDVAATYRQLLRAPLFDQQTESTEIVEHDIRTFVIDRLQVLLSMKAETPTPTAVIPFDEREIRALKILVATLEKKGLMPVVVAPVKTPVKATPLARASTPTLPGVRKAQAPAIAPARKPPQTAAQVATQFKRMPPKPPAEAPRMVEDPRTGEMVELRRNPRPVRSSRATPMPSDMTTAMATVAAAQVHSNTTQRSSHMAGAIAASLKED